MIDTLLRVTAVSLVAVAGLLATRRASSALRHWICFVALAACLAMPLLERWIPAWELPVLPALAPRAAGGAPATPPWTAALLVAWLSGAALLLARLVRGIRAARRLCRSAWPAPRSPWEDLASRVRRDLGLRRSVRLLIHNRIEVPFAWGFFRPVVVLPASAARWGPGQARVVLIHEMAHIRRLDCWTRLVADLGRLVFWFHPVVRLLAREMLIEQEAACDDRVLARGARPSCYAALLLRTVRSLSPRPLAGMVFAFGSRSGLERRIRSLLQPGRSRQVLTSDHHFWVAAAALALVLPAAAVRMTGRPPAAAVAVAPSEPASTAATATSAEKPPEPASATPVEPVQPRPAARDTRAAQRRAPAGRIRGLFMRCEFDLLTGGPRITVEPIRDR